MLIAITFFQVPLWNQKASHRADGVVLWDYHVICVQVRTCLSMSEYLLKRIGNDSTIMCFVVFQKKKDGNSSHLVWDLDSSLPFPSPLSSYIAETIRPSFPLFSEFKR